MDNAVRNMVSFGYSPLDVTRATTQTPAIAHYLEDKKGSLETGKDADLVILKKDQEKYFGNVQCVFVNGSIKFLSRDFQNCLKGGQE